MEDSPKMGETYGKLEESPQEEKDELKDVDIDDILGIDEPKDSNQDVNLDVNEIKIEEIPKEEEDKQPGEDAIEENLPNNEINEVVELKKGYKAPPLEEKADIFNKKRGRRTMSKILSKKTPL